MSVFVSWLALAATAAAQPVKQDPHIGYVYPAGGQAGAAFDVTVGGQYLKEAGVAHISGTGVRVSIVKYYKPLTQGEYGALQNKLNDTREKLEEERSKKGNTSEPLTLEMIAAAAGVSDAQLKEMEIYRQREADPKRQPNTQIMEEVTLHVEIDAAAEAGERELRLITPSGMSNPNWFFVSQWRECRETEPNDKTPDKVIGDSLPAVINGQIMPGDVDRFSFRARKGNRLVLATSARELIPYLADAVPGWFQAVLALYDAQGNEVAYAGAYYFRQDPVLYYEVPEDGDYIVEIRDSIYRGREDFVYRITIGELPFLTGVFPLGGRAGNPIGVELQGWNLLVDKLTVEAPIDRKRPLRWYPVKQTDQVTLRVPLAIDMLAECLDAEPNNDREHAQLLTLPVIVNGRIDPPGDSDVFQFEASGKLVAELYARRFGSPVDSMLRLTDADGKLVASNDDYEDKGMPLLTHHADSRILASLPAVGVYTLRLTDAQRKGGRDFIYRLHLRRPLPDFELRVVPSSIIAQPGTCVPITVYALRREGFDEDILLQLVDAPPGFALHGAWVPAGQDKVRLTLLVPPTATKEPISLQMEGRSKGAGRRIEHPAVPAEAMMQAFAYQHLVPAKDWTVFVPGRARREALPPVLFDPNRLAQLISGGAARLPAVATRKEPLDAIRLELSEPPPGITVEQTVAQGPGVVVTVATDAAKVKPGQKGNLVFQAFREWTPTTSDGQAGEPQRSPLGLLPAVPFEVIAGKATPRRSKQ